MDSVNYVHAIEVCHILWPKYLPHETRLGQHDL